MFCPYCGENLKEGMDICPSCHHQVEHPDSQFHENNVWYRESGFTDGLETQSISDCGFSSSKKAEEGFANYSAVGNDFERFANDNSADSDFGNISDVDTGGFQDTSFDDSHRPGKRGEPKLLILGIIAGILFLLVLLVLLVTIRIIPLGRNTTSDSLSSSTVNSVHESNSMGNENEDIEPEAVGNSHQYDLSSISVSVTDIQPPEIVDNSLAKLAVSNASSDSGYDMDSVAFIIDGDQKTFWVADRVTDNPVIILDFGIEKQINVIEMNLGAWSSDSDYQTYGKPQQVEMEIDGYVYPLTFSEKMTEKYIVFSDNVKASEMKFRIIEATAERCAVSEITVYD